jgi:N-acetylglucosaminyldiphosphoundecaprenol N-acetyl-beta-D-mannosaminyltransferase
MYGRELGVPVMIGVGGTLDFIAGETKRAPEWMQRTGLEWSYRLLQEPRRLWRRYVVDLAAFGSFFVRQWWLMRQGPPPSPLLPTVGSVIVGDTGVIAVNGKLTMENHTAFLEKAQEVLAETPFLIVNLAQASFVDSSGMGALVGLTKQARDAGGKLWLAAVPETVRQAMALMRLDRFFEIVADVETGFGAHKTREAQNGVGTAVQTEGAWQIIKMPRRLDAVTVPEMTEKCTAVFDKHQNVVLDCTDMVFLTSAGLAMLAQFHRRAEKDRGMLRVAGCSDDVMRVIKMTRFDRMLSLFDDVGTAATAVSNVR